MNWNNNQTTGSHNKIMVTPRTKNLSSLIKRKVQLIYSQNILSIQVKMCHTSLKIFKK